MLPGAQQQRGVSGTPLQTHRSSKACPWRSKRPCPRDSAGANVRRGAPSGEGARSPEPQATTDVEGTCAAPHLQGIIAKGAAPRWQRALRLGEEARDGVVCVGAAPRLARGADGVVVCAGLGGEGGVPAGVAAALTGADARVAKLPTPVRLGARLSVERADPAGRDATTPCQNSSTPRATTGRGIPPVVRRTDDPAGHARRAGVQVELAGRGHVTKVRAGHAGRKGLEAEPPRASRQRRGREVEAAEPRHGARRDAARDARRADLRGGKRAGSHRQPLSTDLTRSLDGCCRKCHECSRHTSRDWLGCARVTPRPAQGRACSHLKVLSTGKQRVAEAADLARGLAAEALRPEAGRDATGAAER